MEMLDNSLDNSQDKDDGSDGCITSDSKDMIVTQNLTIVEEDGSLGSGEDQAAVAELAHTQGLLDQCDDEDVHYRFESEQGGPFYVLSPDTVYGPPGARTLAPRSALHIETTRGASVSRRDDRRRATHNEVERRRRDKINQWIIELSKLIPGCSPDSAKTGQVSFEGQSKGGILAKACEYIKELRTSNSQLMDVVNENKRLSLDIDMLQQANDEYKRDNTILIQQLSQHGIIPSSETSHPVS